MIAVNAIISLFQMMYREHWSYIWGKAEKGCVDCSGAFVYAYRQFGKTIAHGSNTIARKYITGKLLPISEAKPGMAAFKARSPGETGYELPGKFKPGGASYNGDLNDYYHIGLVDEDLQWVLNAKGTQSGFCRDKLTKKNGWDFVAYLKGVDYDNSAEEKGEIIMQEARVVLPSGASGSTVNMRKSASASAQLIARVPVGSKVEVEENQAQWSKIKYERQSGWMMSGYLDFSVETDGTEITIRPEDAATIDRALKEIEKQIDVIGAIIGRG